MYGQDNDNGQQPGGNTPPPVLDAPMSTNNDVPMPGADPAAVSNDDNSGAMPGNDAGNYMMTDPPAPAPSEPVSEESHESSADDVSQAFDDNTSSANNSDHMDNSGGTDGLLDLKQQALQQLAPLVDHLDQPPEDEFRTTMMMIQASDNKDLLPKAYEAAQKITDDKIKAQALLDVVNEINYFTQHHHDQQ